MVMLLHGGKSKFAPTHFEFNVGIYIVKLACIFVSLMRCLCYGEKAAPGGHFKISKNKKTIAVKFSKTLFENGNIQNSHHLIVYV